MQYQGVTALAVIAVLPCHTRLNKTYLTTSAFMLEVRLVHNRISVKNIVSAIGVHFQPFRFRWRQKSDRRDINASNDDGTKSSMRCIRVRYVRDWNSISVNPSLVDIVVPRTTYSRHQNQPMDLFIRWYGRGTKPSRRFIEVRCVHNWKSTFGGLKPLLRSSIS
jgi:hypothetical protein